MSEETWHWRWSCRLNAALMGNPQQPVCARVYLMPDSLFRRLFLRVTDWAFAEEDHCMRVLARWLIRA